MLLTIRTTRTPDQLRELGPASHLSFLAHKHPNRVFRRAVSGSGEAFLFFTEASDAVCALTLALVVDPLTQVKDAWRAGSQGAPTLASLSSYVNESPYASASHFATAMQRSLASALAGKLDVPDNVGMDALTLAGLESKAMPFEVTIPVVKARRGGGCESGPELLAECFSLLGYQAEATPLYEGSSLCKLALRGEVTLQRLLQHLYVLLPALEGSKHYAFGKGEVAKILKYAGEWLGGHPYQKLVTERYLKYNKDLAKLVSEGLDSPGDAEPVSDEDIVAEECANVEALGGGSAAPPKKSLAQERTDRVLKVLWNLKPDRVFDLGCNDGKVTMELGKSGLCPEVVGADVDAGSLSRAHRRLRKLKRANPEAAARVKLIQSPLTHPDDRLKCSEDLEGPTTVALLMEVIEHVDPEKLPALEANLFGHMQPEYVIVTTPNREYNQTYGDGLTATEAGQQVRHPDHRFEWTREEFRTWSAHVHDSWGYLPLFHDGIGPNLPDLGAPTQFVVFRRIALWGARPRHAERANALPEASGLLENLTVSLTPTPGFEGAVSPGMSKPVHVRKAQTIEALGNLERHGVDPRWLVYLPPTMSPCTAAEEGSLLERPEEALRHYARHGVTKVVCQEKHMGSRAIVVLCRSKEAAERHFGDGSRLGVVYTRRGRPFFAGAGGRELESRVLVDLHEACAKAGVWEGLTSIGSEWVCLDCEIMPWSLKARGLIDRMYRPVGAAIGAWGAGLQTAVAAHDRRLGATTCRVPEAERPEALPSVLRELAGCRALDAEAYEAAYEPYCWETEGPEGIKIAPFHVLACDRGDFFEEPHAWHMRWVRDLVAAAPKLLVETRSITVDPRDPEAVDRARVWWLSLLAEGGEGMVVKPADGLMSLGRNRDGHRALLQPGIKCRGPEYLRIIYGPEYPRHIDRLRKRSTGAKRMLALREHTAGLAGLRARIAAGLCPESYRNVLAVAALECGGLDPRL